MWLEFSYALRVPCQQMPGQLAQRHKKYATQGFVLIDVDDGSKDKDFEAFKKHVQEKKIEYATLWDKGGKTTKAYGIMAFPSQYLIGVDGTVIWEGNCSREKAKVEALIEAESAKVKKP